MSDIRKIQTGSNQYTLHARVSDKLAIMCSSKTRNNTNYPFHRILKTDVYSNNAWVHHGITLYLSGHYANSSARFGIVDIEFSQNGTGNSNARITWIVRSGFEIDDVQAGLSAPASGTYIDVYLKARTAYDGVAVKCISEGDWADDNLAYKFVNSEEVNNTTASNKLTSYEVYKTIEEAATQLHGKAYTSIIKPTDSGTVSNAGYAEKIGTYKSHPQIGSTTKPVYVDSSGLVKACSREIPTGMTIDSVLNDTSVNAVLNKVINAALKGKNPKAKADFIASSDLTALPITAGVLDLNGYTLTLSGTTLLTGTLTIKNGTIGGNGTLLSFKEDDENSIYNFIYINDCKLINLMQLNLQAYISILNNVHGTTEKLDGDTFKYANLEFLFFGYITNFSNISIKNTNLELINSNIQSLVLTNGCWMKIENANVLIRSSLEIEFYGTIKAKIFSCSDVNIRDYEMSSHNPDLKSTFELYSCSAPGKSDERYFNCGYKYYNTELRDWVESDSFDNLIDSSYIKDVCRYNGTVASYSELLDAKYNKYNIYTIANADATHNIKAGDSIISDGEKWINLSGTVENVGYAEKIGTDKSHPQIGSPTKPVYVDSNGLVKACSREIPTGMTIDTKLSATSGNAVSNKVITEALNGKNPKAKADFIASSDLPGLPITTGVLDLNGYTLTLSGTTLLTGTLTIKNGTIGGEGIISSEDAVFYIYDCLLSDSAKISISCIMFVTDNLYYSHALDETIYITMPTLSLNNKTVAWISNSSCIRIKGLLTSVGDFGVSSIVNSAYIIILNIAINIKTSNTIFLSGVICTHIDSCSNINIVGNIPEFGLYQLDQNSIVQISNCIFDDGTNTSLIMEGWYDVQNHRYLRFGYVDNLELYNNNNFYGLPTAKAVLDYFKNYAKKDEISKVYKYKGTKTNYSELTTSGNTVGDVWNITNADATNGIKAGDNVVWDGNKWDNLSGTVDLSNYLQKGGKQTTTSTADGGSNVYTFKDGSTITVKNGSKGSTGAAATWFSGSAVTGTSTTAKTFTVSGSKAGDMYLNTGTSNVYKATAANLWVYICNIKGPQGTPGNNGTTPTIKAAAGGNIGAVGTPSVTANTSGTTTTFTFNNLKGQKGDTGATVTWHTGTAVTGTAATVAGAKTGDMYLNTKTYNVYKSTGTNKWAGVCNIKGANGTTPTIKAAAGSNINSVGTPTVSATTSGATTTFTFNNLKGLKGETGATITWHTGTAVPNAGVHAVTNAKVGDMYLNTHTCDVFKAANAVQASFNWVLVCNIKGAKGDAANIPKLAKGIAGIVPGTTDDDLNAARWLNGGKNGTGKWSPLPIAGGGTSGLARTCKDYTSNAANPAGYGHGSTPPTIQPLTSGANDYRGVECDKQGMLFVNVPAYEKNINRAQNTVLAAPTTGTGTATFRKLTTSDIPWGDKLKVVTESQFNSTTPRAGVFYFVLEE